MKNNNRRLRLSYILAILLIFGAFINTHLFAEATVFERVRKVEDPELAELIAIAIKNLPESKLIGKDNDKQKIYEAEIAKSKAIRIVTEKYAQIRMLDKKIKQIEYRSQIAAGPNQDIETELMIAKATLQAERLANIAELREALNLVPWTPFGPKEIHELNTWIHFEVLGDTIRIYNLKKPFVLPASRNKCKDIIQYPLNETEQYLEGILKQNNMLPIRITVAATKNAYNQAGDLRKKAASIIKKLNAEYETELSTTISPLNGRTIHVRHHREGKFFDWSNKKRTYSIKRYVAGTKTDLQRPFSIPLTIEVADYHENPEQGNELESQLNKIVNELQLKDLITIKLITSATK